MYQYMTWSNAIGPVNRFGDLDAKGTEALKEWLR